MSEPCGEFVACGGDVVQGVCCDCDRTEAEHRVDALTAELTRVREERDEWKYRAEQAQVQSSPAFELACAQGELAAERLAHAETRRKRDDAVLGAQLQHDAYERERDEFKARAEKSEAERDRLRKALNLLYDEQAGPPRPLRRKHWDAAMDNAAKLLSSDGKKGE